MNLIHEHILINEKIKNKENQIKLNIKSSSFDYVAKTLRKKFKNQLNNILNKTSSSIEY